jgi:hypothetical protein
MMAIFSINCRSGSFDCYHNMNLDTSFPYYGRLNRPTDRKDHVGTEPLVGGIAIYLSVVISLSLF